MGVTNAAGRLTTDFNFDAYSDISGYLYSYNASTMLETITYDGSTFATRQNTKNSDGTWTIAIQCAPLGFTSSKKYTKDSSGNWTSVDA